MQLVEQWYASLRLREDLPIYLAEWAEKRLSATQRRYLRDPASGAQADTRDARTASEHRSGRRNARSVNHLVQVAQLTNAYGLQSTAATSP